MGCPPDPQEVSLYRHNEESENLKTRVQGLLTDLNHTFDMLSQCEQVAPPLVRGLFKDDLARVRAHGAAVSAAGLGQQFSLGELPLQGIWQDFTKIYDYLTGARRTAKGAELALCEARDLLLKLVAASPGAKWPRGLKTQIAREKEKHRHHRREDRTAYLELVTKEAEFLTYKLDHAETPEEKRMYYLKRQVLELEEKRVRGLSDDELLSDRGLFFDLPGSGGDP